MIHIVHQLPYQSRRGVAAGVVAFLLFGIMLFLYYLVVYHLQAVQLLSVHNVVFWSHIVAFQLSHVAR